MSLPLFGILMPYLRGMILKELLQKYEFDAIVPDLLAIDEPVQDNLYAFKEAFDELRRMAPGDAGGKQILVSEVIETDEDGNETERYLHASNCEGDFWEATLAKEVVILGEITEIRALAQILWHITFFGFTAGDEEYRHDTQKNKYERMAATLEYRQFCNYARIKREKKPTDWDLRCALTMEEWDTYHAREAHRNRAKRMRDARQNRQVAKYERLGKIQRLIDNIVATSRDSDYADYKYLFDTKEIRVFEFYSRTTSKETRAQYIIDNFVKYFNEDITQYTRTDLIVTSGEESRATIDETHSLSAAIYQRTGLIEPQYHVHFATDPGLGDDMYVRLICSRCSSHESGEQG